MDCEEQLEVHHAILYPARALPAATPTCCWRQTGMPSRCPKNSEIESYQEDANTLCPQTGDDPNQLLATNTTTDFIRSYQAAAQLPSCPIITFQPPANVDHGPVLVPYAKNKTLGFCQSSQPLWSAHRDPRCAHSWAVASRGLPWLLLWPRRTAGVPICAKGWPCRHRGVGLRPGPVL